MGKYLMGYLYEKGIGVEKNLKKAVKIYKSLSEKDFSKINEYDEYPYCMAAIRMGIIYSSDSATDEEKKYAVEYFKKASDREFLEGMYYTGACLLYTSDAADE